MLLDLHCHSTYSDGTLSPRQLIKKAKNLGIKIFSITDHDTIKGQNEAIEFANELSLKYIPGVEINAEFPTLMDILGYNIDIKNDYLNSILEIIYNKRIERNKLMIELLKKEGFKIDIEDLEGLSLYTIGRPHIARILLKKGYGTSVSQIIETYLTRGKSCYIERFKFSPKKTIRAIKKAGGLAVLAHPKKLRLSNNQLEILVNELKDYGLDGIECFHYSSDPHYTNFLIDLARKNGLLVTAGSDYHGSNKPYVSLGVYVENFVIQDTINYFVTNYYKKS
ncbi:PHP domain-containing protein [Marinitoga aeolica]|uniref:PHP domain-containing protein n=1 Tax=Marinitoga aeolica TaxID=2809031 RepID=A0ABY8PN73_9BACT|nr:PHP domain-containing protein [Marinitoga aeolica]WGS64097.1 PHP domain-containing protein [Marinitoga aeolica]